MAADNGRPESSSWRAGITRYQWTVLAIASLGWVFDVFEGQIFVSSMNEAIPTLVPPDVRRGSIDFYNDVALGAFLLGGSLGGIAFGALADRYGRKRTMSWTIVFYSFFTFLSAAATAWWHLAICRFLVAIGVGGEWAVASALVAEEFPTKARARVGAIFHATSVLGTYLAIAAGVFLIGSPAVRTWAEGIGVPSAPWRIGFALGALPAILILWVRISLREPEGWKKARDEAAGRGDNRFGSIAGLFTKRYARRTALGVILAAVGLATFWGTHIHGKGVMREAAAGRLDVVSPAMAPGDRDVALKRAEMLGMFLVTTGGGVGLVAFGPLCDRIGRRGAFAGYLVGAFVSSLIVFGISFTEAALVFNLFFFGFLTLGMHAGYAVYFPELYPTRLRSTGAGFCFNAGRLLAAPLMFLRGWMQKDWGYTLADASLFMSGLFLLGLVVLPFLPETKGRPLPETEA